MNDAGDASTNAEGPVDGESSMSDDTTTPDPYGPLRVEERANGTRCSGAFAEHVAEIDRKSSFVDGNDLLALVNRSPTGALPSDFAPSDLVELSTGKPMTERACDAAQCLRKETADALTSLLAEMKRQGFPGKVESAFRSYASQCGTFHKWARKGSFCAAAEQSALPGHSQHQLGTTLDLFTQEWARDPRGVFRSGFGCTPAGQFLREHSWEFGFVFPYPIHPDDRNPRQSCTTRSDIPVFINPKTGYRYEHWHLRYIGKDAAREFESARKASGEGSPAEWTLEQWLRSKRSLGGGDTDLPVCDGCNCGACATLAPPGLGVCDKRGGALHLDEHGLFRGASGDAEIAPTIVTTRFDGKPAKHLAMGDVDVRILAVELTVPDDVATATPVMGIGAAAYTAGSTYLSLVPYPKTSARSFPTLSRTWVLGIEPVPNTTNTPWPWRAALTNDATGQITGQIYNRANVRLPASPGTSTRPLKLAIPIPKETNHVKVVLLESGTPRGEPLDVTTPDARSPAAP